MVMWVQKGSLTSYGLALHSPNTRSSLCVIPSLLKQKSLTWNAFVRGCSNDLWNLRSSRCPYFALHYVPSRHISHSIFYLKQLRKSTTKEPSVWSGWAHRSSRLDPTVLATVPPSSTEAAQGCFSVLFADGSAPITQILKWAGWGRTGGEWVAVCTSVYLGLSFCVCCFYYSETNMKRRWQCRTGLSYIITLHYISYHRWMLLFFVTLWMLLFFVTGYISTSLIYCWGDNINQCVGISERKATTERGCLLRQAETWLLCRVAPLRADSGLQCCCKASEAVRQTEGFVVQAGQCGSSAHIHPWFLCCPNCLTCSESLCWWVSVLKRHGIVLLPLVWMSFRGQSSCVSATQICLTVKFVLSIDWFLVCVFFTG